MKLSLGITKKNKIKKIHSGTLLGSYFTEIDMNVCLLFSISRPNRAPSPLRRRNIRALTACGKCPFFTLELMQSVHLAVHLTASKHIAPLGAVALWKHEEQWACWGVSLMLEGTTGIQVCSPDSCARCEGGVVLGL